ncbi:hypothetical protein [Micromonospora sp. ATCC 39149]|uniref:Uncharacterized protein n=1 Tax=Micromonospora carbonacea TaxID=47853 RepID=A0A7D5Y916_9ACTN|nr:hypothetical protein [Micromonospora sp. ATCC 39149]QLJ98859.1 hypothetical protein HZU44_01160 [Micromonospora carbonacea]
MESRREVEPLSAEDAAAEELARRVVRQVAPEEGEIFDVVREAYLRDPRRLTGPGDGRDRMLGFGVEAAAALLTPLVLGISAEVVRHLALEAVSAVEVRDRLRRRLGRRQDQVRADPASGPDDAVTPRPRDALTAESKDVSASHDADAAPSGAPLDAQRMRKIVLTRCQQAGVDEGRARLIADAVVGALQTDG